MAINLDGSTQYISLGAGVNIYRTRPFSVFALVNGDDLTSGVDHAIMAQGSYGNSWALYKATNDYTYVIWNSGNSYAAVTPTSYIGQGWVLVGFAMRDIGSYTQVEGYLYNYKTRTFSQNTGYYQQDVDPPAPDGSLTAVGGRGISAVDVDMHWAGQIGWAGVWAGDLSDAGLAVPPKVWALIQDPYTMIDSNCRFFLPMLRSATKDLSAYALHGTNVGGAGFVGGGPTELPAPGVILITTDTPAANQTVTPSTASLTLSTFAPTVTATNHQLVTPSTASLTITTFAPTVTASNHQLVTPGTASLSLTTFAPTVSTTAHQTVTPSTAALVLTTFAPTVSATAHQTVTPSIASLVLTTFAPTVTATAGLTVVPSTAALTLSTFAPTVSTTAHVTATPTTAGLVLTTFAPVVTASGGVTVIPDVRALTLATFAPTVTTTAHQVVTPGTLALSLSTFAPTVSVSGLTSNVQPYIVVYLWKRTA